MINKKDLIKLRKLTQLGIGKCRDALLKAEGNIEEAINILRKEGKKIAHKRIGNVMEAGRVFTQVNEEKTQGVILILSSETDFVARNKGFQTLGNALAEAALSHKVKDRAALLAMPYEDSSWGEEIIQLAGRVGEHVALTHYQYLEGASVGAYIHAGAQAGAIVAIDNENKAAVDSISRNIAMHIVGNKPLFLDEKSADPTLLSKEKESMLARLPEEKRNNAVIVDKIVQQHMARFINDNALLSQRFLFEESQSVGKYLTSCDPKAAIRSYISFKVGS